MGSVGGSEADLVDSEWQHGVLSGTVSDGPKLKDKYKGRALSQRQK